MSNGTSPQGWQGKTVYGSDGARIGVIAQVFTHPAADGTDPVLATVSMGLFSGETTLLPLRDAVARGDGFTVPFTKAFVTSAPHVDAEAGISPQEEKQVLAYYCGDATSAVVRGGAVAKLTFSNSAGLTDEPYSAAG